MIVFKIFVILFIIFSSFLLIQQIFYGKKYLFHNYVNVTDINKIIAVLSNANAGASFIIKYKNSTRSIQILKNQNKNQWWFELKLSNENYEIANDILKLQQFKKLLLNSSNIESNSIKKNFNIILINPEMKLFELYLKDLLRRVYHLDMDAKVSINFKNTYVEKGFDHL